MSVSITVNSERRLISPGTTVAELLEQLAIKDARVAVEVNLDVIRREMRKARVLEEGDQVEVVSFVGGGIL
jgi:sulfur carrier protein